MSRVRISNLDGKKRGHVLIRKDLKTKGRIYAELPPFASMTPEEAMALADRLVAVAEGITRED